MKPGGRKCRPAFLKVIQMIYLIIAAVITLADQLLKLWTVSNIDLGGTLSFLPGIMSLTSIRNTGAAFSILADHTWILSLISVIAAVAIVCLILKGSFTSGERISLALILGGCVGNAIDRIFRSYVIDMFRLEFVDFAIFNLADVFIDVGAVLFVILYFVRTVKEDKERKKTGGGA